MIVLDAVQTRSALTMDKAIEAMRLAFDRDREVPQRVALGNAMFMPGRVQSTTGVKVVGLTPGNPAGLVAVFHEDGTPMGIVDGPTVTAIRTGAVAGLATDLLAPQDASSLAMLGAGAMAPDQIAAVRSVRPVDTVYIWSRSRDKAEALATEVGGVAVDHPNDAVARADIVSCATPATTPLFDPSALASSVHINAVGGYTPSMVEIPPEVVTSAFVVVDDYAAAAVEAGDIIQAGRTPDLDLADLLDRGSGGHHDLTLFKSVGIASQDIAAAAAALASIA